MTTATIAWCADCGRPATGYCFSNHNVENHSTEQSTHQTITKEQPMSDTLQEREWCDDCHGYTHMPYCPSYGFVKGVSNQTVTNEHQPAVIPAPDISSLLDQLREQWLEVVKERDELRAVLRELIPMQGCIDCQEGFTRCDRHGNIGETLDKARRLLDFTDQKGPSA